MVNKDIVLMGMIMLQYLPCSIVDPIIQMMSRYKFGDLSKYGFQKPKEGPFSLKLITGRSPTIDVGAIEKIKSGEIQVHEIVTQP